MFILNRFIKHFIFIIAFSLVIAEDAFAQSWHKEIKNDSDFFSIREAFDAYSAEENYDGVSKQFQRWAHIIGPRVYTTNGKPFAPDIIYTEWKKFMAGPRPSTRQKNGWQYSGPPFSPARGGGNGRINCLKFHPGDTNTMWAGTPAGGLWKTINGGISWETKTDNLPNLGVADVAINPRYPDSIFMATGDGYGYGVGNGNFWGGTYSMGVLVSADGGETWKETGLNWQRSQTRQIFKMLMHPKDPNLLYATTNNGIMHSKNAGKDWTLLKSGLYKDLYFHPKNDGLLYSATGNIISYTLDTGRTWINSVVPFTNLPNGISLALALSADSVIYALASLPNRDGEVYRSNDWGKTFQLQSSFLQTSFNGWYDLAIGVSPKDENFVVVGGVDMSASEDGGISWRNISNWYDWPQSYWVHADHRIILFYPNSGNAFLSANDGGVFKTVDAGATWQNISSNIQAMQLYKIGSSPTQENRFFAGAQDNGVNRNQFGSWAHVMVGDGMEAVVSHENPNIVYASTQNGNLQKSTNGGESFFLYVAPDEGPWTTPVEMDPTNADILYFGARHLYKTEDGGMIWKDITPSLTVGGVITTIELAPADPRVLYIAHTTPGSVSGIKLRRTTDGGQTWTSISKGLPTGGYYLSDISSQPLDALHIWVTLSGYNATNKVFESKDGGNTWTNITQNLPNVPVNCVQAENSVDKGVYIGTDLGVFYRNDKTEGWVFYNDGLPLTMIMELEILPHFNKIRAATYGRGIWDAPLASPLVGVQYMESLKKAISIYPNPANTAAFISLPESVVNISEIRIYDVNGKCLQIINSSLKESSQIKIDTRHFLPGVYMVNIVTKEGVITRKLSIVK